MGTNLFNKVPDHMQLRENFNLFKHDLKSFLLEQTLIMLMNPRCFNFWTCECIIIFMKW
jgi:hypothetical protein